MHTATGLWMTHHESKRLQRERADLRDWLGRIKLNIQRAITDRKKNKEIELILFEKETVKNRLRRVDAVLDQASELPSVWVTNLRHGRAAQFICGTKMLYAR